jgi:putative NIF3 family GTP cyclohydrolase 1 type 2
VASLDEIIAFLDELLEVRSFPDYGPNGLQVPGAEQVQLVATGVSAHRELFERAFEAGAQLVIAHHGLFWDFHPRTVSRAMRERLKLLFDANLSLAAYHLPLDAHPELGNNALLCEALGLERAEPFGEHRGRAVGFVGRYSEGVAFAELRARLERATGREPFAWDTGPELVRSVGIVSGGAAYACKATRRKQVHGDPPDAHRARPRGWNAPSRSHLEVHGNGRSDLPGPDRQDLVHQQPQGGAAEAGAREGLIPASPLSSLRRGQPPSRRSHSPRCPLPVESAPQGAPEEESEWKQ